MAYKSGEAKVGEFCPSVVDGYCNCEDVDHRVNLSGHLSGLIYLPHSCDEWVIGTKADAEQLIADLQEIIKGVK